MLNWDHMWVGSCTVDRCVALVSSHVEPRPQGSRKLLRLLRILVDKSKSCGQFWSETTSKLTFFRLSCYGHICPCCGHLSLSCTQYGQMSMARTNYKMSIDCLSICLMRCFWPKLSTRFGIVPEDSYQSYTLSRTLVGGWMDVVCALHTRLYTPLIAPRTHGPRAGASTPARLKKSNI